MADRFVSKVGIVLALVTAVAAVLVLSLFTPLFLLLFASALVMAFFRGLADQLSARTRLRPGWSLLLVVLAVVGFTVLGGWLLAPSFAEQGQQFVAEVPRVAERLSGTGWGQRLLRLLGGEQQRLLSGTASAVSNSAQALGYLAVVVVIGLFLSASPQKYLDGTLSLLPPGARPRARQVLVEMSRTLRWFLLGRSVSMVAVGVLTAVSLALLGVPMAAALGLVAGLLTFVPYLGPLLGSVPIAMVALLEGAQTLALALLVYALVQWLEGFVITPLVEERVVTLSPVLTLLSQVLMGIVLGVPGVVLAVPLAAVAMVLVRRVYVEDVLGDRGEPPG